MTPQQGIEEASLAAQLGNAGTSLTPSQNAALLSSLVAAGLTPQQAQQVIASLTPSQIQQLQAGTPYTIYFNTPQGISSSYTPQTTPYSDWQQAAQAQANQQFSPYNTYIAPLLTTTGQWLNTNVAQPIESAYNTYVAPGINAAGQFLNANVVKPVEQFEQGVLNTPLPSLQQLETSTATQQSNLPLLYLQGIPQATLTPMQPTQQPTTIGSLLASLQNAYNNLQNNYVEQPINNYLINPIERWYYNNYQSPQAQLSRALIAQYITALNAQAQQSANTNPNNLINIALQNALIQEAQQPNAQGYYANGLININPASIEAHLLAIPGAIQDIPAGISHLGGTIEQLITGTPQAELPFNPTGNLVYAGIPQQIQNVNAAVNNSIATANSLPWYYRYPIQIPAELVNYGFLQPAFAVAQGAFNIGNPQATNLQRAEGLASTVSSAAIPAQASLYGVGMGLTDIGTNYLFGGQQTPEQAMRSGYQFGAATAPLFVGAGVLGETLSKSLAPTTREILALASETTDPAEKQALLDTLNFVWQHPYVAGTVRLLLRTAPVSSVFGALSTLESYAAGVRNPMQLAESFGLGYAGGLAFQGLGEAIGSATGSLSTLARQALAKTGIIAPVEVSTELGEQEAVNALVEELPNNQNLLYNMIDRSIGRFGLDTTPLKSLGVEDLKSIIASNPQFFLDSRAIAEVDIPISVLQRDLQKGAISQDRITTILRMMGVDTNGMDAAAQKELLMNKLATGDVPRYMLTKGYTLGNTFDFLPSDIRNNLENAARKNPTGDNIVHLTSSPGIIKGNIITIGFAEHPTPARAAFASGLSKYSSAPGAETTALGYAQYANPFAEESPGSILSGELRGSRYFGQVEPLNYYPADWLERIQFARQYDPSIIPKLARTYSPSGIPDELRNFDWFYTTQAAHDGLHIQTPVPEYLGSGELETGTPAAGKLMQGSKYDIITVRPNQG
ncbi:MAG: hypothetical protein QW207_03880, partial [Candidatus Micrarchaeaceae archaeon]